jgi:hypothetical protein
MRLEELRPVTLFQASVTATLSDVTQLLDQLLVGDSATVMWWSAREARWEPLPGRPAADAFELRAFDGTTEVRWLRHREAGHCAVLTTSDALATTVDGASVLFNRFEHQLPVHYLLWGEGVGPSALSEARLGTIEVPGVDASGRYILEAIEYVSVDGATGTAFVAEERLIGIRRHGRGQDDIQPGEE